METYKCSDCGTPLVQGYYICPACKHDNGDLRAKDDWLQLLEIDKKEAKKLGYKTLRPFYEDRHKKLNPEPKSGGFFGLLKPKPVEFNPDEVLAKKGQFYHMGRPENNDWMDVPL